MTGKPWLEISVRDWAENSWIFGRFSTFIQSRNDQHLYIRVACGFVPKCEGLAKIVVIFQKKSVDLARAMKSDLNQICTIALKKPDALKIVFASFLSFRIEMLTLKPDGKSVLVIEHKSFPRWQILNNFFILEL